MLLRSIALFLCFCVLQGCAVSQEGVGIRIPSSDKKVQSRFEQLTKSAAEQGSANPGVIVVGKTSAFRPINERNVAHVLKMYVRDARGFQRNRPPEMTEAKLLDDAAGWSQISFVDYLIAGCYGWAIVPKSIREQIDFSSSALTMLWQDTEDLVAAVTNSDGVLVIRKLLCQEDAKGFRDCKRAYTRGVFDANTGRELDLSTGAPNAKGKRIDTHSFERLAE